MKKKIKKNTSTFIDGSIVINEFNKFGGITNCKLIYNNEIVNEFGAEYDYDERGNCIHILVPGHKEIWNLYDDINNCIYYKEKQGSEVFERWTLYEDNKPIKITEHGIVQELIYNQDGLLMICNCSNGSRYTIKYDNNNNVFRVSYFDSNKEVIVERFDYDEKNRMTHRWLLDNDGKRISEEWFEYDENDNIISHCTVNEKSELCRESFEFNENGDCIHKTETDGKEETITYEYYEDEE